MSTFPDETVYEVRNALHRELHVRGACPNPLVHLCPKWRQAIDLADAALGCEGLRSLLGIADGAKAVIRLCERHEAGVGVPERLVDTSLIRAALGAARG